MDCTSIQDLFTAALDNDLDPENSEKFNAHLSECKHCSLEFEHFQTTLHCLNSIEFALPPPTLLANIEAQIHSSNPLLRFYRWFLHANPTLSLPTATATVVVAFACMLLYKNIFLAKPPIDTSSPLPIAGYSNQKFSFSAGDTPDQLSRPPASVFYQNQIRSTAIPAGQTFRHEAPGQQNFSMIQRKIELPNNIFFSNYIHQYFGQEFVPSQHTDLLITIYSPDNEAKRRLHHRLLAEKKWHVKIYDRNLILLTLDRQEMQNLQNLLVNHQYVPPFPADLAKFTDSKTIQVAIHLK